MWTKVTKEKIKILEAQILTIKDASKEQELKEEEINALLEPLNDKLDELKNEELPDSIRLDTKIESEYMAQSELFRRKHCLSPDDILEIMEITSNMFKSMRTIKEKIK